MFVLVLVQASIALATYAFSVPPGVTLSQQKLSILFAAKVIVGNDEQIY